MFTTNISAILEVIKFSQVNTEITVDQAIKRGHKIISVPVIVIMFLVPSIALYFGVKKLLPFYVVPVGFVLGFILAWLYWSFFITQWKIWAYENVRNLHHLKKRAIRENLIWDDGNFFEKTEIRNGYDKERLLELQQKFNQPDKFTDDPSIPEETIILYSRVKTIGALILMLSTTGLGIYLVVSEERKIAGFILAAIGLYGSYDYGKKAIDKKPQLILNENSIVIDQTVFIPWNKIKNEEVLREGYGKNAKDYFVFEHDDINERIEIGNLNISSTQLENLVRVYRGRFENKTV